VKTHLRTRAFLLCFVPFAVLLMSSFWMVRQLVDSTVRNGLRAELRERQVALATVHSEGALHNSRFLRVAGENSALKAGMVLLRAYPAMAMHAVRWRTNFSNWVRGWAST
jgi:hypothetical protein